MSSSVQIRPQLTFRVGIAGHRPNRLSDADPAILSQVFKLILATVSEQVSSIYRAESGWYSGDAPALRAVSSLAEGTDRIFAEEAIRSGYSLTCPMPFHQDDFETDFAPGKALEPDSLNKFRKLLDQAKGTTGLTRFELMGDRNQEPQSYRNGGKLVLNQSDLLLVVWDGISKTAVGGTEDMLKEALRLHIPVIWIHARAPHGWMILDESNQLPPPGHDGTIDPAGREDLAGLAEIVKRSLSLPGSCNSAKKAEKPQQRLCDFYAEKTHRWNPAILWKIFCIALGKSRLNSLFLIFSANGYSGSDQRIQGYETKDPEASRAVQSGFRHCDWLSGYYGDFYRSGYILTFLLAALAVGLALFPVAAGWLTNTNHTGEAIMVAIELVALLCILLLVFRSRSGRWHGRWLDYRLTAEWIRQLRQLAPLGMGMRVHETRGHQKTYEHPSTTWMAWYIKALERNLGLPDTRISRDYLKEYLDSLIELAQDQKAYHSINARSYHLIERRLHRTGVVLVGATIAACILHLLPLLITAMHWPSGFAYLLTFLSGFLPALGAALAGINNQGEFKTIAKTSESMHQEYILLNHELSELRSVLESEADQSVGSLYKKIKEAAYRICHLMIEELSDWRITYHNRPLDLPV